MHRPANVGHLPPRAAKFRAVVAAACDEAMGDEADPEDVYDMERAQGFLLVTGLRPGSEFLGDWGARVSERRLGTARPRSERA